MKISTLRSARFVCALFVLFLAEMASAAVSCTKSDTVSRSNAINLYMQAVPNALITVCAAGSSGVPCSPLSTLFTSGGASQTNPFFADSNGNYQVCVNSPGAYEIQISGPGLTTSITDQVPIGSAVVLGTNNIFTGNNTFLGNLLCKNFENVLCVDAANSQGWSPGTDFGAWVNDAYAAANGSGVAVIRVAPNGAPINFTTPIVFGTAGKEALLDLNGAEINYTPTTATTAITLNDGPAGLANFFLPHGVINGTVQNNGCSTNGGCSSSATGIVLANTPVIGPSLSRLSVQGFGTGISAASGAANQWGATAENLTLAWNTTGLSIASPYENFSIHGGRVISNGTGISCTGPSTDLFIHNISLDSNTTVGISNSCLLELHGVHYENSNGAGGGLTTHYVDSTGGLVSIFGGDVLDDQTTGNTDWWFRTTGDLSCYGPVFFSAGRTATQVIQVNTPGASNCNHTNNSSGVLTTLFGGTSSVVNLSSFENISQTLSIGGKLDILPGNIGGTRLTNTGLNALGINAEWCWTAGFQSAACDTSISRDSTGGTLDFGTGALLSKAGKLRAALYSADGGTNCTNGELALSGGWQSTGTATVTAVAGAGGQTCSWTITTGTTTAANPTVTDTLVVPLSSAGTVCELNIHGGTHTAAAGEGFQQTTVSATAPVFTFNGTPTANGFTYIVTRRCGP